MNKQDYAHHRRYYPPHHFVLIPMMAAATAGSAWCANHYKEDRLIWLAITGVLLIIAFLMTMMRQHYALGNQDRIVRLEMRLRFYQLTGERLEAYESRLSRGQIAALRFASDEELPVLFQRALKENLSPDEIKRSIRHWMPDNMRR